MARTRLDVALTVAVAALVGLGAQHMTKQIIESNNRPQEYRAVEVTDGTIGARAVETTPRAQSLEEIKAQNGLFTVEVESRTQFEAIATTDDFYSIRLDTDEYVIARVLQDSITEGKNGESSPVCILPIGMVVDDPVPEEVLQLAERYGDLPDDASFYIDMRGTHKAGVMYRPMDAEKWGENAFLITLLAATVIIWQVMVRVGLFPPLFPRREKKKTQNQ